MPSNFFKNFVDKASSATQSALEKGKVQVEITKLNLDSNNAEGHIKQAKESIGDYVYTNNLLSDNADLAKFFDTIREEQARIDATMKRLHRLRTAIQPLSTVLMFPPIQNIRLLRFLQFQQRPMTPQEKIKLNRWQYNANNKTKGSCETDLQLPFILP